MAKDDSGERLEVPRWLHWPPLALVLVLHMWLQGTSGSAMALTHSSCGRRHFGRSVFITGPVYPATSHCTRRPPAPRLRLRPRLHPSTSATLPSHRVTGGQLKRTATATIQMPVVGLEAWFTQIPPVTRTWLALSVLTSVAVVRPNIIITRMMMTDSPNLSPTLNHLMIACSNVNW
jgi:hypothetical protein